MHILDLDVLDEISSHDLSGMDPVAIQCCENQSQVWVGAKNGHVHICDLDMNEKEKIQIGLGNGICEMALSRDGKYIAISDAKRDVYVYDVESKTQVAAYQGHNSKVEKLCFSTDGSTVYTISQDYDLGVGVGHDKSCIVKHKMLTQPHQAPLFAVAVDDYGQVFTSGGDCSIRVFKSA
jgi:WD40 repeat protein